MRWPCVLLLIGCKHPPDAPEDLNQLVGYLFEHVGDEEDDALVAGAENLDAWLSVHLEETREGYSVDNLTATAVEALGEGERDMTGLAGASVGAESVHDTESLGLAIALDDPTEMYPETYLESRKEYEGDEDCFEVGDCSSLQAETWSECAYALGLKVETNSIVQWRWVETNLGLMALQRTWLRSPATVSLDWLSVEQQYFLWAFIPSSSGSVSIQATWVVATLSGGAVPEDFARQLIIDSMAGSAVDLDAWVASK